ncbi:Flagellar basal-body rod protein FlgB [Paramagnetospirillum magnetotacticum MS-1]|uniref:Flagellar basal body rod protein FlgB n=1 Tax=Paramagnetospirillum magnetotacticum MS-1 TaxID=272627 RepID=A0A0C2YQA8_PARME|nr:flagellar basal body rod protein FlgB [Paramagnetospirillum magnetotacticum]KIL97303.1 Flagellar basal-body rod protein FlgB [Paramagnetospirillum magnetotacticum MS-1]
MYDDLGIFKMAKAQMDWIAQRQEVLAGNIANANTPRYLPKDLKDLDFKQVLAGTTEPEVGAATTNAKHIVPEVTPSPFKAVTQRRTYESTPDGNAVILEEQMAKLGDANSKYNAAAALFQKYQKMIKTASGSR